MSRSLARYSAALVAAFLAACSSDTGPATGAAGLTERLAAGDDYTCALDHLGAAWCWGAGDHGQLGNGGTFESPMPVRVGGGPYRSVAAGGDATCGLRADGGVDCWGDLIPGCCGATTGAVDTPTPLATHVRFSRLSIGAAAACGIARAGDAYCWGPEQGGALGDGRASDTSAAPVPVAGRHGFTSVSEGVFGGCGLDAAGSAWCWGGNVFGELGVDSSDFTLEADAPVPVAGGLRFAQLSAGAAYVCGVTTSGDTVCWGVNDAGQLGILDQNDQPAPAQVVGAHLVAVTAGGKNNVLDHTCGLDASGAAWCWGANDHGQLGAASGDACDRLEVIPCAITPIAVQGGLAFTSLALGNAHTCGMVADGHVYCWGLNDTGQLGDGTTTASPVPVRAAFTP